jgi:hypothetical protein
MAASGGIKLWCELDAMLPARALAIDVKTYMIFVISFILTVTNPVLTDHTWVRTDERHLRAGGRFGLRAPLSVTWALTGPRRFPLSAAEGTESDHWKRLNSPLAGRRYQ